MYLTNYMGPQLNWESATLARQMQRVRITSGPPIWESTENRQTRQSVKLFLSRVVGSAPTSPTIWADSLRGLSTSLKNWRMWARYPLCPPFARRGQRLTANSLKREYPRIEDCKVYQWRTGRSVQDIQYKTSATSFHRSVLAWDWFLELSLICGSSSIGRASDFHSECLRVQASSTAPLASSKIVWRNVEARDRVNIGAFVEFNLGFDAIRRLTRRKSKEKH